MSDVVSQIGSDSDSDSSDDENVMTEDFFGAHENGMAGGGEYKRVAPARFSSDSDDIFMRSMINNYALEAKDKDGAPTGAFWMNEATARAAASEVLGTHKGLKGDAL